jgi:UDP-N-acetylglucosamine 1-carboxyvinyltransferase
MDKLVINGGNRIEGEITVEGAKNSVLPILAATIISGGESIIHNVPDLKDVEILTGVLKSIGCKCFFENNTIIVKSDNTLDINIPEKPVREMRSSIILLGAMIARTGQAKISYPGGCELGPRPIDLHLAGLKKLGAVITESHGYIHCEGGKLVGTDIHLDYPSVGATENIMLAAVAAEGTTVIYNAAKEPEIIDLEAFLNKMGARISGAGSDIVRIEGTKSFGSVEHKIISDRIVAGTYMSAVAIAGGDLVLKDMDHDSVRPIIAKLSESGCLIKEYEEKLRISNPNKRLKAIEVIKTLPYPGFPTDMQAQMMAVTTIAKGTSVFIETVFESRYKQAEELVKMGANIRIDGRTAVVKGVKKLSGAKVMARDLRGGAALVLAGLGAEGTTIVENVNTHIDRGYEKLEQKLKKIGADIQRVSI